MKRRGTVFIAEDCDETYLTGVFRASWQTQRSELESVEGLSVEQALAWGRARSDRVQIRLGIGDYYWAGERAGPDDVAPWPEAEFSHLERRRHPEFMYLDRTLEDPPIMWTATLWLRSGPVGELWLDDADERI